jgi:xanthine dehydrogenase YagS FAD-binding subunit
MSAVDASLSEQQTPEFRAGGTDLSERRRSGVSRAPLVDLTASPDMVGIEWGADGAARIGALTTVAEIANNARVAHGYPGLAAAAGGLATPQIRHVATLGGNLAQRSRCWYFRNPHTACLKKGGPICPARDGNHLYGVAFDLGPCVAPHPSTLAAALMAYDAMITTSLRQHLTVTELLGDGTNGSADNSLKVGEIIRSMQLPSPVPGERAFYKRAISRTHAEWPLVELVARGVVLDENVSFVHVAVGGIAPVPLRLSAVESIVRGAAATSDTVARAAEQSTIGAQPLPMTRYKLVLLKGLVEDVLGRLIAQIS